VVLQTADGPLTSITLTRIPADRPPFPVPEGAKFLFTPQTHSAVVQRPDGSPSPVGVRFLMPNTEGLDWIARVINGLMDADPVDLATGLFVYEKVDLVVDDVIPIVISRHYRQGATSQGPRVFGMNTAIPYQMTLTGDFTNYSFAELVLEDGAKVRFTRISPGTGYTDAVFEHTATPSRFYKARLTWNASHGWEIALRDGTVYEFVAGNPGSFPIAIRDRLGNRLTIYRPPFTPHNYKFTRITSPKGRWVEVTWNSTLDVIAEVRDNANRVMSYSYDGSSRLTSVTDAAGGTTT
jgi:YD repeat-containing protein